MNAIPDKNNLEKINKFKRIGRAVVKQSQKEALTNNETMLAVAAFVAQVVAAQDEPQKYFDGFVSAVKNATELLLTHKKMKNDRSQYN